MKLTASLILLTLTLTLAAEKPTEHQLLDFIDEDTLNWRVNPSHNKFVYSSRIKLLKIDSFSASIIYWYSFSHESNMNFNSDKHTTFSINYKF